MSQAGAAPESAFRDQAISRLYRKLPHLHPASETDADILAVAGRVVDAPLLTRYLGWRSVLAALVLVGIGIGIGRLWERGYIHLSRPEVPLAFQGGTAEPLHQVPQGTHPAPVAAMPATAPAPLVAASPAPRVAANDDEDDTPDDVIIPPSPPRPAATEAPGVVAVAPAPAAAVPAAPATVEPPAPPAVDPAVADAILQKPAGVHELMKQGRYDAAYGQSQASLGGPWTLLDNDLLAQITHHGGEPHCSSNGADTVVNDACAMLRDYHEGKTVNPEDVKALGIAIHRYAPEHQYWFQGLQDLLKR